MVAAFDRKHSIALLKQWHQFQKWNCTLFLVSYYHVHALLHTAIYAADSLKWLFNKRIPRITCVYFVHLLNFARKLWQVARSNGINVCSTFYFVYFNFGIIWMPEKILYNIILDQ